MACSVRWLVLLAVARGAAAAGQACSANPACEQLKLSGDCCPSASGENLACCEAAATAEPAASEAVGITTLVQPPAVTQPWGHRQCLLWNGNGCEAIRSEELCKRSRDGRPWEMNNGRVVQGSPCVWCAGKQCEEQKPNLCSSYGWLHGALGNAVDEKLAKGEFGIAECTADQTIADTMSQTVAPKNPPAVANFVPMDGGQDKACRGSYLADTGYQAALPRFGAGKSYTIWSAASLEACKAFCDENCRGIEYNEENRYCEIWHHPVNYTTSMTGYQCYKVTGKRTFPVEEPSEESISCLQEWKGGCSSIENKITCLSSKDGSSVDNILGLKIKGQPCVWCKDGPCTSNSRSVCEPYDYLRHGEGKAFSILHARQELDVARCFSDANQLGAAPDEEDSSCLEKVVTGCNHLFDAETCLKSKDGRSISSVAGLKVHGEPCVWCGGGFCSSNNANLCEPYQFAVYGQNHAFNTFLAKGDYKVAACNNGAQEAHVITKDTVAGGSAANAGAATAPSSTAGQGQAAAAAAGTAAAAEQKAEGKPAEDQVSAAGAAAAAVTKAAESGAEEQAAAASSAAAAAATAAGMTQEQVAAAAGEAATEAGANAGMSVDASSVDSTLSASAAENGFTAAATAGAAAATAAAAAGMPAEQQAVSAGTAAETAAAGSGLAPEQQAAAAGAAAGAAAANADEAAAKPAGQQAIGAIPGAPGMTRDEEAAAAGKAAASAAALAGLDAGKQAAAAGAAAAAHGKTAGMSPEEQAAAAGAAAAAAGKMAAMTPEQQAAAAGAAAAAAAQVAGLTPEEQVSAAAPAAAASAKASGTDEAAAAGAAASAAAQSAGMSPEQQAPAAGKAAASAASAAGLTPEQQAAAAGAAAAAASNAAGMTPQQQAAAAGAAAAAAAKAAGMSPEQQAAAAGTAAAAAAKAAGMTAEQQATAAGVAAAAAAKAAGLSPEQQAAAAGDAAGAAAKAAGMTPEKQAAVAGLAAKEAARQAGLTTAKQAAAAGAAAAAAARAAGMTPEEQAAAAGAAGKVDPPEFVAPKGASGDGIEAKGASGEENFDNVQVGNVTADQAAFPSEDNPTWPWWATLLIVCGAVLVCVLCLVFVYAWGGKDKRTATGKRAGEVKRREYSERDIKGDGEDVELQAPLVKETPHHIFQGPNAPSMVLSNGQQMAQTAAGPVTSWQSQAAAFAAMDTNHDGVLSRAEWQQATRPVQTPQYAPALAAAPVTSRAAPVMTSVAAPVMTSVAAPVMTSVAAPVMTTAAAPVTSLAAPRMVAGVQMISTPQMTSVAPGPVVAAPGVQSGASLFDQIDLNHDGTLDRREWAVHEAFTALDRDHNGVISPGEWQGAGRRM